MIGATTLEEYRKFIEKDAALERRFRPVIVREPDRKTACRMLEALRPGLRHTTASASRRRPSRPPSIFQAAI